MTEVRKQMSDIKDKYHISKCRTLIMGTAILWIMFYHCEPVSFLGVKQIQEIGYLGVEIFLCLSSFGLYYAWQKSSDIWSFYKKRMLRILPFYIPALFVRTLWDALVIGGRLSENSNSAKISPTNDGKIGVNCQCNSHFMAENSNKNGIESHQPLVFGQSGGDILNPGFVWYHMYFKIWYVPFQLFLYIFTPVYLGFFCKNPKKVTSISILAAFIFSLPAGWSRSSLFIAVARIPAFLIGFYLAWCNENRVEAAKNLIEKLIPEILFVILFYGFTIYLNETYDHQVLAECGMMWYPTFFATLPLILMLARGFLFCQKRLGVPFRL